MSGYLIHYQNEYLSHHGIDGQKWGVRNGPPYPLGSGSGGGDDRRAKRKKQRQFRRETRRYLRNAAKKQEIEQRRATNYVPYALGKAATSVATSAVIGGIHRKKILDESNTRKEASQRMASSLIGSTASAVAMTAFKVNMRKKLDNITYSRSVEKMMEYEHHWKTTPMTSLGNSRPNKPQSPANSGFHRDYLSSTKDVRSMSNKELNDAIARRQRENTLKDISKSSAQKQAERMRNHMLNAAGQQAVRTGFDIAGSAIKGDIKMKQDLQKTRGKSEIKKRYGENYAGDNDKNDDKKKKKHYK